MGVVMKGEYCISILNVYIHNTYCTCGHEKSKIPFSYMLYAYSVKEPIGELNLKRALDEDTGVFSSFFSLLLLSSSSPLGQTAISGNSCTVLYTLSIYSIYVAIGFGVYTYVYYNNIMYSLYVYIIHYV